MQDGGVLPVTGFPQVSGTAKEGHHKDDSITMQNSSISFNTCIRSTGDRLIVYTFEVCIFRWNEYVEGRNGTRVVEEVVVHGSSCEVVVHVSTVVEVVVHVVLSNQRRR